ncbi:GNAT family N-acetyltransferase [Clostridium nigeriense]|uniref:GNAT family N-acetyltransferase n=1 Tax=Clostridium nigeriense TaxID=1805470 RepID=UPI000833AA78|nr:GNAT family N-acetyltransferase [Clostridium nigeriense]
MEVREASFTEVNQIRKWLKDTASWLKEKNIPQWERFLEDKKTEICLKDYNDKKLYVLEDDDKKIIGAMSFGKPEDIDIKLWDKPEDGYYIHRIVLPKEYRGKKKGEYMINWAKEIASNNKKELRLNCVNENEFLFNYYSNQGFNYNGSKLGYHLFKI